MSVFKTQTKYFWAGLLIYAVSFFLVALSELIENKPGWRGYYYAYFALGFAIQELYQWSGVFPRFEVASLLISGAINIVFLFTALLGLLSEGRWPFAFFRALLLLMLPFCWVVFRYQHLYPREVYVLWTLDMLLTLFSRRSSG